MNVLSKSVLRVLRWSAQRRARNMFARIVGITGSVGKTSAKEAIYHALSHDFKVRRSMGNLNSEFGLCLAILGFERAPKKKWQWIFVTLQAIFRAFTREGKYDVLVLEYGIDGPRDMEKLTSILSPDVAVFTTIAPVHLELFSSVRDIWKEKSKLARHAKTIVVNADDSLQKISHTHSYGKDGKTIVLENVNDTVNGLSVTLSHNGAKHLLSLPHLFGEHTVYAVLAAITVAAALECDISAVCERLASFKLPPGRMNKLAGIHGSVLIDSSYNASPCAMEAALKTLKHIEAKRKIAVLGMMNELGDDAKKWHRRIGKIVGECADVMITVGRLGYTYVEGTEKAKKVPREIHQCKTAEEAGEFLKTFIQKDDVVLFKGSQNEVWLERAITHVLADQADTKYLVRTL